MSDGVHPDSGDAGLFDAIDPKLTVFALANGMDLAKGDDHRRLEWFTEGLERGILIEAEATGSFRVSVMSWPTGSTEVRKEAGIGEGISAEDLAGTLPDAIDSANGL